eukprot:7309814-Prymnesium_polylepis.1
MHSPTVFNFYDPLYQPEGPISEAGLISPEAELGTGPFVVGFMNTLTTAIRGNWAQGTIVGRWGSELDLSNAPAVVEELGLLLTAGRLNSHSRSVITERYENKLLTSTSEALQAAQVRPASPLHQPWHALWLASLPIPHIKAISTGSSMR